MITNVYFRFSLNFILKLNFNIYMHKKTINLYKENLHII
jgi:hypothetical protein